MQVRAKRSNWKGDRGAGKVADNADSGRGEGRDVFGDWYRRQREPGCNGQMKWIGKGKGRVRL